MQEKKIMFEGIEKRYNQLFSHDIIQDNGRIDGGVENVTRVIIQGVNRAF